MKKMPQKIPKAPILYSKQGPPPFVWVYECQYCLFWSPPQSCVIVEGDISPTAWCILWLNTPPDLPFSYLFRRVR